MNNRLAVRARSLRRSGLRALALAALLAATGGGLFAQDAPRVFETRFFREQVWDVQRSPSYPSAGSNWVLSKLKAPYDALAAKSIDWGRGNDRYLMFGLDEASSSQQAALVDDLANSGRRYSLTLDLYERNGSRVKTVSRWGALVGVGSEGFLYEQQGAYGTFFSPAKVRENALIVYRPKIARATRLSEILDDAAALRRVLGIPSAGGAPGSVFQPAPVAPPITVAPPAQPPASGGQAQQNPAFAILQPWLQLFGVSGGTEFYWPGESSLFEMEFQRQQVGDAQRQPAYPEAGRDWLLSWLKAPFSPVTGQYIDWGPRRDRYVKFFLDENRAGYPASLADDVKGSGRSYSLSLLLFERDGGYVGTVSRWGRVIGIGGEGFMYEAEGNFGIFFTSRRLSEGAAVSYRPWLDRATKLSQLSLVAGASGTFVPGASEAPPQPPVQLPPSGGYQDGSSVEARNIASGIVGTWQGQSGDYAVRYVFEADGSCLWAAQASGETQWKAIFMRYELREEWIRFAPEEGGGYGTSRWRISGGRLMMNDRILFEKIR
ncbi:hypothetical protein LWX53_09095 [bacterium]|nr:hypothetical protein [bacterium]